MARNILALAMAVIGTSVAIEQVHALTIDQPIPSSSQSIDSEAAVRSLAMSIKRAADTARAATPADADAAARLQALSTAVQEVVVTSGASPTEVLSAIFAVRNCGAGGAASTDGVTMRPGLVTLACSADQVGALDQDMLLALANLEARVLALLEGEQPAALSGGFFGGLNIPASAGLSAGGSDYIG